MSPDPNIIVISVFVTLLSAQLGIIVFLLNVLKKAQHLDETATKLYLATRWRSSEPKLGEHVEAMLWKELRGALYLEPGTATKLGVGDPNA